MANTLNRSASLPPGISRQAIDETAEGYLEALNAQGVEYLFLNPGTDTFPVQEAAQKLAHLGKPAPKIVLCLFEIVALAAAHGYFAATGRPQAVLVHVDVGTQNLGSMLHNAQRGRAAVVISAGRAPYTSNPENRGSRTTYIHWLQEQMDQHGIVRNYTKWDFELRRADQIGETISRAFQIAKSDPPGPTYLTLPREVLMESAGELPLYDSDRYQPAKLGAGDPQALREVARRLVDAEHPVVLTATTGRTKAGYQSLVELAELLALPVVEWRDRANFPGDHPLHQGYDPVPLVDSADVILMLDHDVPYYPSQTSLRDDTYFIQIDLDPIKEKIPIWSFPVDLPIKADTSRALSIISDEAAILLTDDARLRIEERRALLSKRHDTMRSEWATQASEDAESSLITVNWLGHCLRQLQDETPDITFVDEMVTNNNPVWKQLPVIRPDSWYGSGGSGLGWGLGAALGVKLARPNQQVVALVGDGSFMFGTPTAALWSTRVEQAPILVVILNNTCYNATKQPLIAAYPDGYSVMNEEFIGVDLVPHPRYDILAQAAGAYGEQVSLPEDVLPALRRGLERVASGQSAVLDIHLSSEERHSGFST